MLRTMTCSLVTTAAQPCIDAFPIPAQTKAMGVFSSCVDSLVRTYGSIDLLTGQDECGALSAIAELPECAATYGTSSKDHRMTAIKLYVDTLWISPYAYLVHVVLREKRLPFDVAHIGLHRAEQLQPSYRDASLTAKVPALEHDGFWLAESLAIVEYLEERFPAPDHPSVWPSDVQERARARQIIGWLHSGLLALREERPTRTLFYEPTSTPLSPGARLAADKLIRVASALLHEDREHLFETWCAADASLALMLQRLVTNGDPVPERVRAYANAQWQRPSVREFVEHERPAYIPYG